MSPDSKYDWSRFEPAERAVILFVRKDSQVLLIHKKRGLGHGKVNGPGGRIEPGESASEAAIRETREEVGLMISDPVHSADLKFAFTDGYLLEVAVFVTHEFSGELVETDEAKPFWVALEEIPYDRMWADDRLWLPQVLRGSFVTGKFVFDDDSMLSADVQTHGAN
jgi:8-oxo-dGTP diphosphatase